MLIAMLAVGYVHREHGNVLVCSKMSQFQHFPRNITPLAISCFKSRSVISSHEDAVLLAEDRSC